MVVATNPGFRTDTETPARIVDMDSLCDFSVLACWFARFVGRGRHGKACAMEDYIGLIDVGDSKALVLGDEPARTAFWSGRVRWRESSPQIPASMSTPLWAEPLVLFDSSADGPFALREERAVVTLPAVLHTVQAAKPVPVIIDQKHQDALRLVPGHGPRIPTRHGGIRVLCDTRTS